MGSYELSIVIPCFNHGFYLLDCLDSLKSIKKFNYEVLIVNDGSTENFTLNVLDQLKADGFLIINQENQGLARARNNGINQAKGKYIIPLDSDNRLDPEGVQAAIEILENTKVDIVYGNPEFFGNVEDSRLFQPKKFDVYELFKDNFIDACAIFRRTVWEVNGGYDPNMPYPGHEDWEFWINAYQNGFQFHYENIRFFYYRVLENSMITKTNSEGRYLLNHQFIVNKHFPLYRNLFNELNYQRKRRDIENNSPFRTALKYLFFAFGLRK